MDSSFSNNRSILWADDDPDDLMLMKDVLKETHQFFKIVEVHNGMQALSYLKKCNPSDLPCLIILDMNMPVLNGQETLAILKNEKDYHSIPIVVFTTSNSELDKAFCNRYNVDMITKPPEYSSLHQVIMKLISYCNE